MSDAAEGAFPEEGEGSGPGDARAGRTARLAALEAESAALRDESARLRRLIDAVRDHAIVALDARGEVTLWNAGAREILGYREEEMLGRSAELVFPEEDRAEGAFVKELCRAVEEGRAPNERWHVRRDGSRFWASGAMLPVLDGEGQPKGFVNVLRDGTAARQEEERRRMLVSEMGHRLKNSLAMVQAIAHQTLQGSGVPEQVRTVFTDRLVALARAHDLLLSREFRDAPLEEVLARSLAPHGVADRARLAGPPVRLPGRAAEMLGLAFHELATNAAKYGALSTPEGRVEVGWTLERTRRGMRVTRITWTERGGPRVAPPARQGFGSRLLERGVTRDLGGTVKLDFRPEGLECRICVPVVAGD